jgi:ribulose kinase
VALGAAILGCLAAGSEVTGYPAISTAVQAMARQREDLLYRPDLPAKRAYAKLYAIYRSITPAEGSLAAAMRELRSVSEPKKE